MPAVILTVFGKNSQKKRGKKKAWEESKRANSFAMPPITDQQEPMVRFRSAFC